MDNSANSNNDTGNNVNKEINNKESIKIETPESLRLNEAKFNTFKLNRFIKKPWTVGILTFFLGASLMFIFEEVRFKRRAHRNGSMGRSTPDLDASFGMLPNGMGSQFEQIQKFQKRLLEEMNQNKGSSQDSNNEADEDSFGFFNQRDEDEDKPFGNNAFSLSLGDMHTREDDNFIYFDIKLNGLEPSKLEVRVEGNQVIIDGEFKGKNDSIQSKLTRSFPAPSGVDLNKYELLNEKEKIVIKFPKLK